jgi:hypothetical protein
MRSNSMTLVTTEDQLELFAGGMSQAVCRVYARWSAAIAEGYQLSGTLTGPNCIYGETLPATARFVDRGPGGPPLAEAIIPEPCFWTPQMPQLYRARLQLRHDETVAAEVDRSFGIRPLGASGSRLRLDGKTWVVRGVTKNDLPTEELPLWHNTDTALVVTRPSDALCEAASRIGVLIVAELDAADLADIRRLSQWPAVGVVSLPTGASPQLGNLGHNLLLAERIATGQKVKPAAWADVAICEVDGLSSLHVEDSRMPVIVRRPQDDHDVNRARMGCDRLQAELAPRGQFAGYIV